MTRAINPKIDALFVEGPDDGAVVNAFVKRLTGADLARRPYLVRTNESGGGAPWALRAFDEYVTSAPDGARIGLIIDRDGIENRPDNWPKVSSLVARLGGTADGPRLEGHVVHRRFGIWMWPDNVTVGGDLETFVAGVLSPSPVLEYRPRLSDCEGGSWRRV